MDRYSDSDALKVIIKEPAAANALFWTFEWWCPHCKKRTDQTVDCSIKTLPDKLYCDHCHKGIVHYWYMERCCWYIAYY